MKRKKGFPQRRKDAKVLSFTLSLRISLRLCAFAPLREPVFFVIFETDQLPSKWQWVNFE
jgi:hypothetical protein